VIGSGARLVGDISNCSVLEVHGYADGTFKAENVLIHDGGELHGQLETQDATVCGTLHGTAVIEKKLDIRETGSVSGDTTYGELCVESGGSMTGSISVASDTASNAKPITSIASAKTASQTNGAPSLLHRLVPETEANGSAMNGETTIAG